MRLAAAHSVVGGQRPVLERMAQRRRIDELRGYEPSGADTELPLRSRCSVLPAQRASAARFGQSVALAGRSSHRDST